MTTDQGHFTIRPIAFGDAREITLMTAELSQHEGAQPPLIVPEDVEREMKRPDCVLQGFMAVQGQKVFGYALFTISFDTESGTRGAYMCDLYVRSSARRNGLGQQLMAAIARATADQGGAWIAWGALAKNEEAQRFYAKVGKAEEGVELWSMNEQVFRQFKTSQARN